MAISNAADEQVRLTLFAHCKRVASLSLFPDELNADESRISEAQIRAVAKSSLGENLSALGRLAIKGVANSNYLMELGVRFFEANAMRFRYPLKRASNQKDAELLSPLSGLRLWLPPRLANIGGTEGHHSLHRLDQASVVEVASEFYQTGIRCEWFAKMLIEALIGQEAYAFREETRANPAIHSGRVQVVWTALVSYAYQKSNGSQPKFEIYVWLAHLAYLVLRLAAMIGLTIVSAICLDSGKTFLGYAAGTIAALLAISMAGQFVTTRIVRWVQNASGDAWSRMRSFHVGALANDACLMYAQAADANMNPRVVRHLLTDCVRRGLTLSPIVFAFLDRAIDASEHRWGQQPPRPSLDWCDEG